MHFIAIQMLLGDRGKYIAMVVGLMFASLVMTQQPAIYVGLINRTYAYISEVDAPDIWVMDPTVQFVEENKALRDTDLQRVRGIDNVEWAAPLHKSLDYALLPDGSRRTLEVSGIDDATLVGAPKHMLEGNINDLHQQDAIILDAVAAYERMIYKDPKTGKMTRIKIGDVLEINDHRAVVVGIAKLERTFTLLPIGFTTYTRSIAYSPSERRMLSYILVKSRPGSDPHQIIADINNRLGLAAYTPEEFKQLTSRYWRDNTGIPINFGIAVLLGFLVGSAVAGQTFYGFVRENMKQYAALKAMGVSNSRLVGMVLLQALIVGVVGYGLGIGLTTLFGAAIHDTALAFQLTPFLLLFSGSGIAMIMTVTALISLRTVIRVDPATVFRS